MTHHSSAEIDPERQTAHDVPLSDRPLVTNDQNTVVASGATDVSESPEVQLTATAQQIHDRLFSATSGDISDPELMIAHFRVQRRIGAGGMGAVFRAIDTELARPVALKVLHPGIAADAGLVARFRKEARAAAQLNHDNIARVFLSGEQDGVHFIAYEFADGENIKELITTQGRLPVQEVINYAIQTTFALNHLHTREIVHRDIKPSNIILTKTGRIKVVDLGLARRETTDSIGDLTVAGTTLGTFDYISPEQARDPSSADIRSDIYSLGCSLYHMLTGQPPYPEGTALQKLLDHQGKKPPDPTEISSDVPPDFAFVVQKMMYTDAQERYQDPGQLLADLMSVASAAGLKSVPAEGVIWRRVPLRRVRDVSGSLFLALATAVICVTALVMHFMPASDSTSNADAEQIWGFLKPPGAELRSPRPDAADIAVGAGPDASQPASLPENDQRGDGETTPTEENPRDSGPPAATYPFMVRSADGQEDPYVTLAQAWAGAESGDVIVLDFDGAAEAPVQHLSRSPVSGSIEIRAAVGRRPLLDFRVDERSPEGQLFYLDKDLTLSITGVDLRLTVAEETRFDVLTLFNCVGENRVSIRDSTIEVANPGRHSVAIFRLTDSTMDASAAPIASCSLSNIAVRGACDMVMVSGLTPLRFDATECGFALDGSLINNRGSDEVARVAGAVDVHLAHTSSVVARAAFRMEDSDSLSGGSPERTLSTLSVTAESNVFVSFSPDRSLVQSLGNAPVQNLEDLFIWNGDYNFYHNFDTWWELNSANIESPQLDFEEWKDHWRRISDAAETKAAEFDEDVLKYPEELAGRSRAELARLPTRALQLQRQVFFSPDSGSEFVPNEEGRIPGVDQLLQFPDATPLSSTPSFRGASADITSGGGL